MGRRWTIQLLLLSAIFPLSSQGASVSRGQVHSVEGTVSAIDVVHRAVVVDVATPKGTLTVGVTLKEGVAPTVDGAETPLSELAAGQKATLVYTRDNGTLVGTALRVKTSGKAR